MLRITICSWHRHLVAAMYFVSRHHLSGRVAQKPNHLVEPFHLSGKSLTIPDHHAGQCLLRRMVHDIGRSDVLRRLTGKSVVKFGRRARQHCKFVRETGHLAVPRHPIGKDFLAPCHHAVSCIHLQPGARLQPVAQVFPKPCHHAVSYIHLHSRVAVKLWSGTGLLPGAQNATLVGKLIRAAQAAELPAVAAKVLFLVAALVALVAAKVLFLVVEVVAFAVCLGSVAGASRGLAVVGGIGVAVTPVAAVAVAAGAGLVQASVASSCWPEKPVLVAKIVVKVVDVVAMAPVVFVVVVVMVAVQALVAAKALFLVVALMAFAARLVRVAGASRGLAVWGIGVAVTLVAEVAVAAGAVIVVLFVVVAMVRVAVLLAMALVI